jgi:hypothetical protein
MTAMVPPASDRVRSRSVAGWRPALAGLLFWILLPAVCLLAIAQGVNAMVSHVNHVPEGVRGTFLVTTHNCQQQLCITGGTFTSDDKQVVAQDLLGVYRWTLGTQHRAVYNADAADVIPLPAHWDPTGAVLGLAGALTLFGLWGWCLRAALRRRRGRPVEAARLRGGPTRTHR